MKKLIIAGSLTMLSLGLMSCSMLSQTNAVGGRVVGTSVGLVSGAGHVVTGTFDSSVRVLTGRPANYHDVSMYNKKGVVYHNGHAYKIHHGKYVLVQ